MELPVDYNSLAPYHKRRVRNLYVREQKGLCYYCKSSLDKNPPKRIQKKRVNKGLFPEGFFDYPVHLHHNHKTGLTIGAVHNLCNAVLWQYHNE